MSEIIDKEKISKYRKLEPYKIISDYKNYKKVGLAAIFFIIPLIAVYCIYKFIDQNSTRTTFMMILALWSLLGFYYLTRPIFLRLIFPLLIIIIDIIIFPFLLLQSYLAFESEITEKKLEE